MTRRGGMGRGAWLLLALFASGCARPGPLAADPVVAARQVEKLVPRGLAENRATDLLVGRGFAISRLTAGPATNRLLVATCVRDDRMWQIGIVIVDARVAGTSVTVTELGAPAR